MTIRVATWNIAGGHTAASTKQFDYEGENVDYFCSELQKVNPDIICLQEVHTSQDGTSKAHSVAQKLGCDFVYNSPFSSSHIDRSKQLGNAMISKKELQFAGDYTYPYPDFGYTFKNGKPASRDDKGFSVCKLGDISVVNTHLMPIGIFGVDYMDNASGRNYASQIECKLISTVRSPAVICGDFNHPNYLDLYPKLVDSFNLRNTLPSEVTRPLDDGGLAVDYILAPESINYSGGTVVKTDTDHYLCYVDLDM